MKKIKVLVLVLAGIVICGMICSFFVCPLPNFTVSVDGFAEHKIIGGRFAVVTPLEADSFYSNNDRKFPRLRYISAYKRRKIQARLDYFIENASDDDIKNIPMDMMSLKVVLNKKEYVSIIDYGIEVNNLFIINGYNKDYTYDGAVELWVEVARSSPFFSTNSSILLTNTWLWLYGDRCVGVSESGLYNNPPRDKIVQPNKFELFIENLVVWYINSFN